MNDPNKCPTCGGEMLPLATSTFCPKNCDRPDPVLLNLNPRTVKITFNGVPVEGFMDGGLIEVKPTLSFMPEWAQSSALVRSMCAIIDERIAKMLEVPGIQSIGIAGVVSE